MCGHVGVYGKLPSINNKTLMAFMLLLDSTRGTDGTGIYSNGEVHKTVGNVYNLIESREWEKAVMESDLMLGHNRASSVGKNSTRNTHPFRFGDIVGAHNGTLIKSYLKESADFDVDSECLYYNISKHGIKETAKDMSGSWSLVWYNEKEKVLRFLRNKERPMCIADVSETREDTKTKEKKEYKAIIWASEEWMIRAAANKYNIKIDKIEVTKEDHLYEWALDEKGAPILLNKEKLEGRFPEPSYKSKVPNSRYYSEEVYSNYYGNYLGKRNRYKKYKRKEGKFKCSFCGGNCETLDIAYAYPVYDRDYGEPKMNYICKDCENADYMY